MVAALFNIFGPVLLCLALGPEKKMATGRSNKLVGQTGEYLVAAELSRRGLIATTFTGNVPHYDIIASTRKADMSRSRSKRDA